MADLSGEGVPPWARRTYDLLLSRSNARRISSLRMRLLHAHLGEIGPGTWFSTGIKVVDPQKICIGRGVAFSNSSILQGSGGLRIGDEALIGFQNVILTRTHRSEDRTLSIQKQGFYEAPVSIGRRVWTGCRVTVLPGVNIGDDAIVGAGSVVAKDIEPGTVVGGVPAKLIRYR